MKITEHYPLDYFATNCLEAEENAITWSWRSFRSDFTRTHPYSSLSPDVAKSRIGVVGSSTSASIMGWCGFVLMIAHMIAPHTILLSVFILAFLCSFFLYLLGFMKHEVINVYDRQGNHCFWFSFAGNEEFFSHLLKKIAEAPLEEGNPNNQMQNIGTNAPNSDL